MNVRYVSPEDAAQFLKIPEIWERTADDNSPKEFVLPNDVMTFGGYISGDLIGLGLLHPYLDGQKLHYQVLKSFRRQYARELLTSILDEFSIDCPVAYNWVPSLGEYRRVAGGCNIYVAIPTIYPEVINFARHSRFYPCGVEKGTYPKHGKRHDKQVMIRCHS